MTARPGPQRNHLHGRRPQPRSGAPPIPQPPPAAAALARRPDLGLLGAGAVVFGAQRLVPTYDNTYYKEVLKKPE